MFSTKISETSDNLIDQTSRAADQALKATQHLASDAADRIRDTSHQLRVTADQACENTANYIKHEPVKSILIAAATGAALMALISLISGSRSRH